MSGRSEGEVFLERVSALLPVLAEQAFEVERAGRIPDETIAAMRDAGVFRAVQPKRWGGLELDPATFFEGMVRIGTACGSSGWVAGVVGVHPWQIGIFPDAAQRDVWQDNPDARASSSYAPTGKVAPADGGFRLSGRWGFSSGVDFCQWALLGGVIPDAGEGPEFRTFLVPCEDFDIDHDSWHVSGLQASGSKDVVIEDAFVPEHRTHSIIDAYNDTNPCLEVNQGPLFRMPWFAMYAYAITAPVLGAAIGALDAFTEQTSARVSPRGGPSPALNPAMHGRLSDALIVVDDARRRMVSTWDEMYQAAQTSHPLPLQSRAQCRYEAARSAAVCLEAVMGVFGYAGGGVMRKSNPVQRFLRDILAMRNHPFVLPEPRASVYAKAVLGVAPGKFNPASPADVV